ncbi:MAG: hypothetical protein HC848_00010 [Limnobacter sp.]|nr:hypothetical protein [Limnobacter sp.]
MRLFLPLLIALAPAAVWAAQNLPVVDLGNKVPTVSQVEEGLFPEAACEELRNNGFKCMGFKPAVKFSMPAAYFRWDRPNCPRA